MQSVAKYRSGCTEDDIVPKLLTKQDVLHQPVLKLLAELYPELLQEFFAGTIENDTYRVR